MNVFDMDDRDSYTSGLLGGLVARLRGGGLLSRYSQPDPPADVARLAWRGLQALAPHITDPATYAPLPPPSWTPTPEGKLPSSDRDPRVEGVMSDLVNIGMVFAPMPGAGVAVGAGRWLPGLMRREASVAKSLASKSPMMYNPPPKPLRPFERDYPNRVPADAGRLTHDIEGRSLTARYVVGRRMVGGNDEALPPAEFNALAEATTGGAAQTVPSRQTDFGRTLLSVDGRPLGIELRGGMPPEKAAMVYAHELGHAIDQIAGQIPTKGVSNELKGVYNTLNNPNRAYPDRNEAAAWGRPFAPQALGYKGEEIPREYMVEAIRAYLADPNYLKTVAPGAATRIREYVNSHPELSRIIQLNTLAGPAFLGSIDPEQPTTNQFVPESSQ